MRPVDEATSSRRWTANPGTAAGASSADEPPTRCRPFTVIDAMALIAATAVGLAGGRYLTDLRLRGCPGFVTRELPMLLSWTVALLALRFRGPRPERRLALSQPGAAACATVLLFLTLTPVLWGLSWAIKSALYSYAQVRPVGIVWAGTLIVIGSAACGAVVAGAWLALAVSGLRRPEPGWLDRLGRIAGTCWVLHFGVIFGFMLPAEPPIKSGVVIRVQSNVPGVSTRFAPGAIPPSR